MFLERVAIFTLQVREKILAFLKYFLRETDSQLGQIFFTCSLLGLSALLIYSWLVPSPLWLKIVFSILYLICLLICASAIHFLVHRKRIRNNSGTLEVYSLDNKKQKRFHDLHIKAIALSQEQSRSIFRAFSNKYIDGTYHSFQSLILLQPLSDKERLKWKDLSPKRSKQVNRQTLLEFLSQLMIGFENLENHQIKEFVEYYFILINSEGNI